MDNKEMLLGEILIQTVANVFKNPNVSYFNALQITISKLEKENKLKAKQLVNEITNEVKFI